MKRFLILGLIIFSFCCNICFAEYETQTLAEQEMAQKKNLQPKTFDPERFHTLTKEDWKVYKLGGKSVTGEIYMLREKNYNNLAAAKALNEMLDIIEFEASNDIGKSLYKKIKVKNEDYNKLDDETKHMIFMWNYNS